MQAPTVTHAQLLAIEENKKNALLRRQAKRDTFHQQRISEDEMECINDLSKAALGANQNVDSI